jgi:hypothetical protein
MVHSADVRSVCIRFGFISNKLEFSIMPLTAPETHDRLNALENKTRRLELLCFAQFVVLIAVGFTAVYNNAVHAQGFENVLHARGLVIEDGAGKPRILVGAPFPSVRGRFRQDSTTTAMVFLDERGRDRLTLGEEPEPQVSGRVVTVAHRIASGFGVVIHDGEGNERGAYGWLANGRALITLDRPGLDAWAAIVDDKTGFAGMRIEYPPDVARDSNGIEVGTQGRRAFFRILDTREKERAILQYDEGGPTIFRTRDRVGKVIRDLALSEQEK